MELEERLLSSEDITQIEHEAKNPIYREPSIFHMGRKANSILRVSEKGVILIRGNEDTGLEHINRRHNEYTKQVFWKRISDDQGNEKIKLDNPSKFSIQSIPVFTYTDIADKIFSADNKKPEENKRADLFDVYSGEYVHNDGTMMKYRLITYKDTKIIHTLIPLKKTYTREKILDLYRGSPKGEHSLFADQIKIEIPYLDHKDEIVCSLIFIINGSTGKEEVFVEHLNMQTSAHYIIAERQLAGQIIVPRYMTFLEFADLKEFEKIIKKIISTGSKP